MSAPPKTMNIMTMMLMGPSLIRSLSTYWDPSMMIPTFMKTAAVREIPGSQDFGTPMTFRITMPTTRQVTT